MAGAEGGDDRIRVYLRIRPQLDGGSGEAEGLFEWNAHRIRPTQGRDAARCGEGYLFQRIFGQQDSTADVYAAVSASVRGCLDGVSATVMAYGQTAAGKTHTITGTPGGQSGLVQMAMRDLLAQAQQRPGLTVTANASFFEVYNARVYDLAPLDDTPLTPTHPSRDARTELRLYGDGEDSWAEGLAAHPLQTVADAEYVLNRGLERRARAATLQNECSSRSHAIFQVDIEAREESGRTRWARLCLCDLAGSEHAGRAGTQGDTRREGSAINCSLLALQNVIQALAAGRSFVPYRDSKLTRLLHRALGGNSRTSIVCCIAPEARSLKESVSTLQFASRASVVCNAVRVNEIAGTRVVDFDVVQQGISQWSADQQQALQREAAAAARGEAMLRHALSQVARDRNDEAALWSELDAHAQDRIGHLVCALKQERAGRAADRAQQQCELDSLRKRHADELASQHTKLRRLELEVHGTAMAVDDPAEDELGQGEAETARIEGLDMKMAASRRRMQEIQQELAGYRTLGIAGGSTAGARAQFAGGPPTTRAALSRSASDTQGPPSRSGSPFAAFGRSATPTACRSASGGGTPRRRPGATPPRTGPATPAAARSRGCSKSALPPPRRPGDSFDFPSVGGGARMRTHTPTTPQRLLPGKGAALRRTPGSGQQGTPGSGQRRGAPQRSTPSRTFAAPGAYRTPPGRKGPQRARLPDPDPPHLRRRPA